MAQLKDTTITGDATVSGTLLVGSNNLNVAEQITNINNNLNYYITSEEKKTPDYFFGKSVYTKSFKFTDVVTGNAALSKIHGISNIENIWIDTTNSFMKAGTNGYVVPIVSPMYYGRTGTGNNWSVGVDKTSVYIYADSGWNENWTKVITVRYTKTTD